MTDIWLVRHGEAATSFDQDTDPPLSDLGREQAARTAEYLSQCVPDDAKLLTSPKLRATTAAWLVMPPRAVTMPSAACMP